MRVLVTGAGGQLGVDLVAAWADADVTGLTHAELNVTDEAAVAAAMAALRPQLVVNAAAMTDVDGCEADPTVAHAANALGPWWLARACDRHEATLVHISTDYVFSGPPRQRADGTSRGWTEFDPVAPANVYGQSKHAGEQLVRQTLAHHHIVRSSWLAGAAGSNFVTTMLRLGTAGEVRVVSDQFGCWTSTSDLAASVREVAASGRFGTVHRANTGQASWADVAEAVFAAAGMDVDVVRIPSSEMPRPAPRPAWSVLDQGHAAAMGLTPLPDWHTSLDQLVHKLLDQGTL